MMGQTYRMNLPTLGIHMEDGHRISVTIPKGALIAIEGGPLDGMRLVDVTSDGAAVMMFTADVRKRGTAILRE
jgi:hypothetical protein